jgi:hypothetical protein
LIFKSLSFVTLKASNIFELFSIFVAAFFPRNVSRADWHVRDRARAAHGTRRQASGWVAAVMTWRPPATNIASPCGSASVLPARIGRTVFLRGFRLRGPPHQLIFYPRGLVPERGADWRIYLAPFHVQKLARRIGVRRRTGCGIGQFHGLRGNSVEREDLMDRQQLRFR